MRVLYFAVAVLILPISVRAEVGVTENEIKVGQSAVITRPSNPETLETLAAIQIGSRVFIAKTNESGGVNGRKINVLYRDDSFEPRKTVENTRDFIEKEKVFCLFNYNGSPAATAVRPLYQKADVPFIFPSSGLDLLRYPVDPNTFTLRASSDAEAEALVSMAADTLGLKKVAVLYRTDAFGESGRRGISAALNKRNMRTVIAASYRIGDDTTVDPAAKEIFKSGADAVLVWAPTTVAARFLKLAAEAKFKAKFLGPTNAATPQLLRLAKKDAEGFIATSAFPVINKESSYPLVQSFNKDMEAAGVKETNSYTFEGYINALVFVEALKRGGKNLTRASLRTALEKMKEVDIGGVKVSFSATDHQGIDRVFMSTVENGEFTQVIPTRKM